MNLKVIGSSSAGNGYLLDGQAESLIIETGCKFSKVKQAIDFKVGKIAGALISHSHKDHAGNVAEYLREGVKVYTSPETCNELGIEHHNLISKPPRATFMVGGFKILPFVVVHDVTCYGYLIQHPECGKVVFITDTHYSPVVFNGLNQIIIEANYSTEIINKRLQSEAINRTHADRVIRSHMSLETAMDFLKVNDLSHTSNIVLIHLSDGNSDANLFKSKVEQLTGKPTYVADSGITINFNKQPF